MVRFLDPEIVEKVDKSFMERFALVRPNIRYAGPIIKTLAASW